MEKKLAHKRTGLRSQSGFTLLEMMSVLVILGVIFSVTIHRFSALSETAYQKAIESAIQELNIRETLVWSDFKISQDGWQSDNDVFTRLDTTLGGGFYWKPSAGQLGGDLHFGPHKVTLVRVKSTSELAGSWK
jgi:prepilin-type N-terminal cleavage/methylation domain-containing protein